MRHAFWATGLIVLFSAAPARAEKKEGNWLTRMFGGKAKAQEPKKEDPAKTGATPSSQAVLFEARQRYLERVKICNKLREIALQTGDDALERRAEQLEDRVWTAYRAQIERLSNRAGGLPPEEQITPDFSAPPAGVPGTRGAAGLAGRK
jgi:hypothetical protein